MNENKNSVETLDIINLVRTTNYSNHAISIKNYELSLQKIFSNSSISPTISDPFIFLLHIDPNEHTDLFPHFKDFSDKMNDLPITVTDKFTNVVFMGPYIRNFLIKKVNYPIRKEIYLYKYTPTKWDDMLDISKFSETKTEFIYEDNDNKISLVKKKYKSPSHIMLQHNFIKRVGIIDNQMYISSMFLLEYQNHIQYLENDFCDPYLHRPYDPLDVYEHIEHDLTHPIKAIEMADLEFIKQISQNKLTKLYGIKKYINDTVTIEKLTPMEFCLDKYSREKNPVIKNELRQSNIFLNNVGYKRPPYLYAKYLNLDIDDPELYNLLITTKNKYNIINNSSNIVINSIADIDLHVIKNLISKRMNNEFIKYINYINYTIDHHIIDIIIRYQGRKNTELIKLLLDGHKIEDSLCYYACMMSENFELTKLVKFDYEIALNYLKDIIEKCLPKSLYFLLEHDDTILNTQFDDDGNNIFHIIKPNENKENLKDMIDLLMIYVPQLINKKNNNGDTPVIHYSKIYPELLEYFLEYDIDIFKRDNEENTFIHHLCKINDTKLIKGYLKKYNVILDLPNKNMETPAIVACINKNEDVFYIIKSMGADLNAFDIYGNTVYHYICKNVICIGHIIENIKNKFGLTPAEYCIISKKFYSFNE